MLNSTNITSYLAWSSKRVSDLITTHPSTMISIIKQIQGSITCEAKWLKWVWRKCKRKANYPSIQGKALTPPQTKSYGWQIPIFQLKRAATKTHGFSMTKDNTPPEAKMNHKLPLKLRQSNQVPNSTKDANFPWSREYKVSLIELRHPTRQA
jgi:hypothetical protein